MLSKIVLPGSKLEITRADAAENRENFEKKRKIKTYFSKVYDIIEEDKLKIAMPTEGTRLITLEPNTKYELCIFTERGLYKCKAVLTERYKEDNLFVAVMELYTGLQKYQRRQHYRLECNIELQYRILTERETELLLNSEVPESYQNEWNSGGRLRGITLDISGGGVRFVSDSPDEKGKHMLIEFDVPLGDKQSHFSIISVHIDSKQVPNRENTYEHRVQFLSITKRQREDLIKYIFEEERRFRKREKG